MRALVVLALVVPQVARAAPDPELVARRWLAAMHDGDTKQLAALTALPLVIAAASISDGQLVGCGREVASRDALFRKAGEGKSLFADPVTPGKDASIFDCPGGDRRRLAAVPMPAGSHDVAFDAGSTKISLRISKAGQVAFVSVMHDSGGI